MKKLFILFALLAPTSSFAYEVETHGLLTREAFDYSNLGRSNPANAEFYARLGFDCVDANAPFNQDGAPACAGTAAEPKLQAYIDAQPGWLTASNPDSSNRKFRCVQEYERASFQPDYRASIQGSLLGATPQLRLEAWLMRGVIREDDLKADKYTTALRPDADPWGDQDRPINHFYDPVTNESGTPLGGIFTQRSLNWAMGEANPLQPASVPDPSRGNHFSYMDARRNFFLALTYKTTGTTSATLTTTDSLIRQNLWASTMLSMGHVVHLLQDQASPQHARAEAHNYVCRGFFSLFNAPEATRTYENFINYRVIRLNFGRVGNPPSGYTATNLCEEKGWQKAFADSGQIDPPLIASWLRTGGGNTYPVPQFSVQRKFFTTRENDASGISTPIPMLNMRAGLGDYSNRGFYTEGKMAGSGNHAFISPPRLTSDPSFTDGVFKEVIVPGKGKVKSKGLLWQVPDAVAPGYPDTGLTGGKAPIVSYGQWGFFGAFGVKRRILTLDNYNQMADMLIPRAVAYSAGMVNFFFCGKLEIEPITQRVFGVLNQGEPHTVNADGYPTRTSNGKIFGFEKSA